MFYFSSDVVDKKIEEFLSSLREKTRTLTWGCIQHPGDCAGLVFRCFGSPKPSTLVLTVLCAGLSSIAHLNSTMSSLAPSSSSCWQVHHKSDLTGFRVLRILGDGAWQCFDGNRSQLWSSRRSARTPTLGRRWTGTEWSGDPAVSLWPPCPWGSNMVFRVKTALTETLDLTSYIGSLSKLVLCEGDRGSHLGLVIYLPIFTCD